MNERTGTTSDQSEKRLVLEIELPSMYTADLEGLREYMVEFESESAWLLNCIGEPGTVRLRCELSGEKDSDVVEVWGQVREAKLVEPGGFDEEFCSSNGQRLLRDEHSCEWCDCELNAP